MSSRFRPDVYANRLEVFRHTLRNLALASAAASGLALGGCADSHVVVGDAGAPTDQHSDAGIPADQYSVVDVSDAGVPADRDTGVDASDAGVPMDQYSVAQWQPSCPDGVIDLTGVAIPAGVDAYRVYRHDFTGGWRPSLGLGDLCGPIDASVCASMVRALVDVQPAEGPAFAVVRRGDAFAVEELASLRPATVDSPQAAVLYAADLGFFPQCAAFRPVSYHYVDTVSDGFVVQGETCIPSPASASVHVAPNGEARVIEKRNGAQGCSSFGRLTDGCDAPPRPSTGSVLGRFFAQAAGLEAAAVWAFERMSQELTAFGAPAALVERANNAADEEREHTQVMGELARHFGVTPTQPTTEAETWPTRSLFDFALENAIEGCVRETYGAVVGHHQATQAANPIVQRALRQVADDETGHAALSWAVANWAEGQLSDGERELIEAARARAIHALRRDAARPQAAALVRDAGLPSPEVALSILDGLTEEVWAA